MQCDGVIQARFADADSGKQYLIEIFCKLDTVRPLRHQVTEACVSWLSNPANSQHVNLTFITVDQVIRTTASMRRSSLEWETIELADKTAYARSLGYRGIKPVVVMDGRVISHRNADVFTFFENLRRDHFAERISMLAT